MRTESEGFSRNLRQDADFPPPVAPEDIETPGATAGDGGVEAVAEDENSGHKDLGDKLDEALDPLEQAAQDDETSNRDHG